MLALMALLLLSAFGVALLLVTSAEITTAANYRDGQEALHAADGALERAIAELLQLADWDDALTGTVRSRRVDGAPAGARRLPSGGVVDLDAVVNRANCGKAGACSASEMDATTAERPWGRNNPRFRLFAYGPGEGIGGPATARSYVLVMVADDPMENDNDPEQDGSGDGNPGRGRLVVRAEAFGPGGAHTVIEATILRPPTPATDVGYKGQRGAGEWNDSAGSAIPVPVSAATRATIPVVAGESR